MYTIEAKFVKKYIDMKKVLALLVAIFLSGSSFAQQKLSFTISNSELKLPITFELKANDIFAVINEISKDSVCIIGFSDGAYTAYKVASMYPQKVKKLVAIGAGEQIPGLRKVVFSGEAFETNNDFWKKKLSIMPEPNRIKEFWRSMENFYNSMSASKALFNSIKCPVLLLAGENDKNALLPSVINAYNMIPNSQLSIIPNTGHVVFMENFPAVWASIVLFLNKI